ncbi:MAG TPA: VWA domain-containing protein [Thermoanaerobaculia bacterium]|jgi:VWFA-related protein|nr:VWA domain-containing protein [Thermoanaerobaculia bacterium]
MLASTAVSAQSQPAETLPYTFGEVYSVEMVMVPVAVRGETPGERLPRDNFSLRVDGKPVKIESFENDAGAPLSLVFLQDLSGSMAEAEKMASARESLDCFLDTARKSDELALATFAGGRTEIDVPLTSDVAALREAMSLWEPYGTTGLYDAVATLPEISLGSGGAKRAAVLVTDGVDNVSAIPPEQAQKLVQAADLPVYVLALPGQGEGEAPAGSYRYGDLLRQLAEATGGRYYELADTAQARRTCAAILGELRHQYVLGFSVSGTGPSAYHPIRVELRNGGRRVSLIHRRGYRGTAPSAEPS